MVYLYTIIMHNGVKTREILKCIERLRVTSFALKP